MSTEDVRQWTVKGISVDVVNRSRQAARARGMHVNSFVEHALIAAIDGSATPADDDRLARFDGLIERLNDAVERLESDDIRLGRDFIRLIVEGSR